MPKFGHVFTRCRRVLSGMLLAVLCVIAAPAQAEGIDAKYVEIVPQGDQFVINAAFRMQASPRLEELVSRGITLPFVAEFTLKSGRWYWWDEVVVDRTEELRLSYHALTRQYRVTTEATTRNFASLDEALRGMLTLDDWPVVARKRLTVGNSYKVALRMRLNLSLLSKPLQAGAIGDNGLDLASNWQRWTFLVVGEPQP